MSGRRTTIIILIGIILLAGVIVPVHGDASLIGPLQTWPSRTPTSSSPPNPTQPSSDDGEITATPQPAASPSVSIDTPIGSTPISTVIGQPTAGTMNIATAAPCQFPPTAMALGTATVRSGPGLAYASLDSLVLSDVRIVTGRAGNFPWWQIQWTDSQQGWVAASAVTIQGDTANVPIVPPPLLNGNTPVPGPLWQPTSDPTCILTVNAASPPPTSVTATVELNESAVDMTPVATSVQDELVAETAQPTIATEDGTEESSEIEENTETKSVESENSSTGDNANWLLWAGLISILGAGVIYLVQRRSS